MTQELTLDRARKVLDYDQSTGAMVWKTRAVTDFRDARAWKSWNARFSAKAAGHLNIQGYMLLCIDHKFYLSHRVAWLMVHGRWPENEIDHINGEPADNRLANLRTADHTRNMQNARVKKTNKSGLKGAFTNQNGTFSSYVRADGKRKYLGRFVSAEEAHEAYKTASTQAFGEFAHHG